jgi:catechol 2,3-dioxygenase-like lactoylglutathione lyase family enzyme
LSTHIATLALLVRDYDEAIAWFSHCFGFGVVEDTLQPGGKRWVVIGPPAGLLGRSGANLLLARAATPQQEAAIGNQAGGRVFLFLETDNFDRDHARMAAAGVRFHEDPRDEPYGRVAVFEDLYGNKWDLIERGA